MDALSDVLAGMHVRGFGYARLQAHAPWGVHFPSHSASIGMVVRGNCFLTVDGSNTSLPLTGGDCFLMTHGSGHTLRSSEDVVASRFEEVFVEKNATVNKDGDGPLGVVVGGWFRLDTLSSQPLMRHLPPLIVIPTEEAQTLGLHSTLQQMANETATSSPGSRVIINRLAEILFIQVIRAYISSEYTTQTGWLAASGDKAIGNALQLMHSRMQHGWTVEELANNVGLSRSAFAQRFRRLVGEAPLEYLTNWRIFKASELLRGTDLRLAKIAQMAGYESDAAFSRVFRKAMEMSPGQYRSKSKQAKQA
jgi:AraC-like DNA-binding protein